MIATIEAKALTTALATVTPALPRTAALAALSCVHIETVDNGLRFTCTDLDNTTITVADATVTTPGAALVPARTLTKLANTLAGTVTLDASGHGFGVTAGKVTASLPSSAVDEYPRLHATDGTGVILEPDDLDLIARVLHAASTDGADSAVLRSVHVAESIVEATERHRAARATITAELPEALIPATVLARVVAERTPVTVTIDSHSAQFTRERTTWRTNLTVGDYPNMAGHLRATSPHHATIDRHALLDALRITRVLDADAPARLTFNDDGTATVTTTTQDIGTVTDIIEHTGNMVGTIGANTGYLADLVTAAGGDTITIGFDGLKPAVVHVEGLSLLLMPVRLP